MNIPLIELIITFIGGGGLLSALSIPYARKKAKAEMEASIVSNYETLQTRFENIVQEQDKKIEKLEMQSKIQYDVIMRSFECQIIRQHTDYQCPVQERYELTKE